MSESETTYEQRLILLLESGGGPDPELAQLLQSDAAAAADWAALRSVDSALQSAAVVWRTHELDEDLWPRIESALATEDSALESAIAALAPDADAPEDLLGAIMASLPSEDETGIDPALEGALISLGSAYRAGAPEVNLVDLVLDKARQTGSGNIVTFPNAGQSADRKSAPLEWRRTLAVAAVAVMVFGAGFFAREVLPASSRQLEIAQHQGRSGSSGNLELARASQAAEGEGERIALMSGAPDASASDGELSPPGPRSKPAREARPLTLKELVDSHLGAMRQDAAALNQMGQWASLTPEEASELIQQSGLSPDALLGATQFLAPEQAIPLLEAAIVANPDDPYLRYALSDQYRNTDKNAEYLASLRDWQAVDPDNALPLFLEAEMALAQGDLAGGNALLDQAASAAYVESYDAQRARQHAAALEAAGYSSENARYLAAVTAGSDEYAMLHTVGDDLMEQGRLLEEQGLNSEAADVYDALRVMGEQAELSAQSPNSLTAALEIQDSAINALYALQDLWQPETLDALEVMAGEVVNGLQGLADLMDSLNQALNTDPTSAMDYTENVLNGDIAGLFNTFLR
ncbi:MAG: hypothetical protein GC168_17715 [Candidatus Hydrogenedens sp.]|nr:hypothetical protein [Candidatus Hydrogenedens sp.]